MVPSGTRRTQLAAVVGVREGFLALAGAGHHVDVLVRIGDIEGAGVGYLGSVGREVGVAGARGVGELLGVLSGLTVMISGASWGIAFGRDIKDA